MVTGSCLCGDVTWQAEGPFQLMSHCHCGRCRKTHGTAFSSALMAPELGFRATGGGDGVVAFAPEGAFARPFCGRCGSSVPAPAADGHVVLQAGSLDGDPGVRPLAHIFVASRAPWFEIADSLPRFDAWPPGFNFPALPDPPRSAPPPGVLRGSCLCGGVAYEITGPPRLARFCHCGRCRKARAAAHASNLLAALDAVRFTRGEDRLASYKVPEARFFTQVFCRDCGAKLPRLDAERKLAIVPMGSLDDDPGLAIQDQIWVGSKAPWYEIADAIPRHLEGPPG